MRHRIVDDRDLSGRRSRVQEELLITIHDARDFTCRAGALRYRPIELDHAEAAALVPRIHRIPRVEVHTLRAARQCAPGPDPQVVGSYCRTHIERNRAETRLQLADIESRPPARIPERSGEIEQRAAPD